MLQKYLDTQAQEPFPSELKNQIEITMDSFCNISGVPVTFFDNQGNIRWECHADNKICRLFDIYMSPQSVCGKTLCSSANVASQLGEPYIFVCLAGFVKIAVSLIIDGELCGCFMAGPIVMGSLKESSIANMLSLNQVGQEEYPKLSIFLRRLKVFKPKDVSFLAILLNSCILSAVVPNQDYAKINHKFKEQLRIGENVQRHKRQNQSMDYPFDIENEVIQKIKGADSKAAKEAMQNLLNKVSIIEAGNLSFIKTRIIGFCALLTRVSPERNTHFQELELDYIDLLNEAESFEELCVLTDNLIDLFSENTFGSLYSGSFNVISQAIQYINAHYADKISLKDLANLLHVNSSYFSMLFKRETGITFTDYLSEVRIKSGKDLLKNTNLSLVDISLNCGFEDQSYFTKVFKKLEGSTPKQYRKMQQMSPIES